jgi:hypothetical protein
MEPALALVLKDNNCSHLADFLKRVGICSVEALQRVDDNALCDAGIALRDRKAILALGKKSNKTKPIAIKSNSPRSLHSIGQSLAFIEEDDDEEDDIVVPNRTPRALAKKQLLARPMERNNEKGKEKEKDGPSPPKETIRPSPPKSSPPSFRPAPPAASKMSSVSPERSGGAEKSSGTKDRIIAGSEKIERTPPSMKPSPPMLRKAPEKMGSVSPEKSSGTNRAPERKVVCAPEKGEQLAPPSLRPSPPTISTTQSVSPEKNSGIVPERTIAGKTDKISTPGITSDKSAPTSTAKGREGPKVPETTEKLAGSEKQNNEEKNAQKMSKTGLKPSASRFNEWARMSMPAVVKKKNNEEK